MRVGGGDEIQTLHYEQAAIILDVFWLHLLPTFLPWCGSSGQVQDSEF